tara:strand:+ start:2234 stop:2803 length:570 start_codon:yes stop_codon:yes gene_type:complete
MGNKSLTVLIISWLMAFGSVGQTVKTELTIKDVSGKSIRPFSKTKPSVLIFTTYDCPVANKMAPEIQHIASNYKDKINFLLVYTDPDTSPNELVTHRKDFGLNEITSILDAKHTLVKATGAEITPEAVIIKKGKVLYRGRINNFYEDFGKPRRVITQHDLRDAIAAILSGKKVPQPRGECIGCYIPKLK